MQGIGETETSYLLLIAESKFIPLSVACTLSIGAFRIHS